MKDGGEEQQEEEERINHYCKVCERGFGCASALGGHMRSHGVGEDASSNGSGGDARCGVDDSNYKRSSSSEGGGRGDGGSGGGKHSYFLRKANRSTSYRSVAVGIEMEAAKSERKKIPRKYDQDNDLSEEDLANCLVMLSNTNNNKSLEENSGKEVVAEEEEEEEDEKGTVFRFQCKACKKVFSSHQALGGHRASHKKVKGCYHAATRNDEEEEEEQNAADPVPSLDSPAERHSHDFDQAFVDRDTAPKRKSKEHECSVCHRVFSSGQALGGHKRCHWLTTTNNFPVPAPAAENKIIEQNLIQFESNNPPLIFSNPAENKNILLDLNSSPPLLNNNSNENSNTIHNLFKCDDPEAMIKWEEKEEVNIHNDNGESHDLNRRTKEAKLSGLKDSNVDGGSSGWLQVGISSTTETTT